MGVLGPVGTWGALKMPHCRWGAKGALTPLGQVVQRPSATILVKSNWGGLETRGGGGCEDQDLPPTPLHPILG